VEIEKLLDPSPGSAGSHSPNRFYASSDGAITGIDGPDPAGVAQEAGALDEPAIKSPLDLVRWLHEQYAERKEIELFDAATVIEAQDRLCKRLADEQLADMERMEQAADTIERLTAVQEAGAREPVALTDAECDAIARRITCMPPGSRYSDVLYRALIRAGYDAAQAPQGEGK
jgi:hypothetical protein